MRCCWLQVAQSLLLLLTKAASAFLFLGCSQSAERTEETSTSPEYNRGSRSGSVAGKAAFFRLFGLSGNASEWSQTWLPSAVNVLLAFPPAYLRFPVRLLHHPYQHHFYFPIINSGDGGIWSEYCPCRRKFLQL